MIAAASSFADSSSLAFLETVFVRGNVGFAFVGTDQRFRHVNEAFAHINGFSVAAHLNRTVAEIVGDPLWNAHLKDLYTKAFAGIDTINLPLSAALHGDSSRERHVFASYHAVREAGRVIGVAVVLEDLTQRVQAENAVREMAVQQRSFLRDMLKSVTDSKFRLCETFDDLPEPLAFRAEWVDLADKMGIRGLRRSLIRISDEHNLNPERMQDLEIAAGEAAMNAIVHAGGGRARVCVDDAGIAQVWVQDGGRGINMDNLHNAALQKGWSTAGTMGLGMKMMLRTADRIFLLTGPGGTTVVLEQERNPPTPDWLMGDIRLPGDSDMNLQALLNGHDYPAGANKAVGETSRFVPHNGNGRNNGHNVNGHAYAATACTGGRASL